MKEAKKRGRGRIREGGKKIRREGREKEGKKREKETHQEDTEESESCFIVLLLNDQCSPLIFDVDN